MTLKKFTFIVGPVAAGKTTLMDKIYNIDPNHSNLFDHDKVKLMIQLYGENKGIINDLNLENAFRNTTCLGCRFQLSILYILALDYRLGC